MINRLSQQTALPHKDLLAELSQALPEIIDQLAPRGTTPDQTELLRMPAPNGPPGTNKKQTHYTACASGWRLV